MTDMILLVGRDKMTSYELKMVNGFKHKQLIQGPGCQKPDMCGGRCSRIGSAIFELLLSVILQLKLA